MQGGNVFSTRTRTHQQDMIYTDQEMKALAGCIECCMFSVFWLLVGFAMWHEIIAMVSIANSLQGIEATMAASHIASQYATYNKMAYSSPPSLPA